MCCSAFYHLFHCMSESASKKWLRLDLGGISVGLCGCYFPGAYYAFYCHVVSNEQVTKLIIQNFHCQEALNCLNHLLYICIHLCSIFTQIALLLYQLSKLTNEIQSCVTNTQQLLMN